MKTMTFKELGGGSNLEFQASTFQDMLQQIRTHAMQIISLQDPAYLYAMEQMQTPIMSPTAINNWMEDKRKTFEDLQET